MPVSDVRTTRTTRTVECKLDLEDAKALLAPAGKSVSGGEREGG